MTRELLQQVRLLDPVSDTDRIVDVLIEAGVVRAIATAISDYPADTTVHACRGCVLGPGLIDLYSHSGEPGYEDRETLMSLRQAAAAGGFTRVAILPDTRPALDTMATIAWMHEQQVAARNLPQLACWAALTMDVQGQQLTELGELAAANIAGFADGKPITNGLLLRRILEYARPLNQPIALWACDPMLAGNGVMREGEQSIRFGLPGIPAIAETAALAMVLECVEAIGTPVHLMRISTARGVDLIQAAKARGVPITASTTWMHLVLNSDDIASYNSHLRLDPPLGNPTDQAALNRAVREGVLDAIAIDHTPHTYEDKTVAFAEAPAGAIGLELALPLLWQRLVQSGAWSALQLWRSLSSQAAICLGRQLGAIAVNQPAELTLFDPQAQWTVTERSLKSLSSNTPWLGQELTGRVVRIWRP